MVMSHYHHYLLNTASRQNKIAMIPRDLQLPLLLQSLQRHTTVLPVTTPPQPSPTLPAGDAVNGMLVEFLMSRTTDKNILSLRHIAAGRLNEIKQTLSLLFHGGR
jgi:hypothetical protein